MAVGGERTVFSSSAGARPGSSKYWPPTDRPDTERETPRRLGILGGTFDPIHIGHLIIAEEARDRLALDAVLFIPAKVSPLKLQGASAPAEHRCHMVELAIADNPFFYLSRVELERAEPSYTVDTLRALRAFCAPQTELFFIMGVDSLSTLKSWRCPQEILRLARIIAVSRPGFQLDMEALERDVPGVAQGVELLTTVWIGVSSTEIRARLERRQSIKYLVPAPVEAYIREQGLYTTGREPAACRAGSCC